MAVNLRDRLMAVWRDYVELWWVAGLALVILVLVKVLLPLTGEAGEWAQYLSLGTVFPLVVSAMDLGERRVRRLGAVYGLMKAGLIAAGLYLLLNLITTGSPLALVLAGCQGLVIMGLVWWERRAGSDVWPGALSIPGLLTGGAVLVIAWLPAGTTLPGLFCSFCQQGATERLAGRTEPEDQPVSAVDSRPTQSDAQGRADADSGLLAYDLV